MILEHRATFGAKSQVAAEASEQPEVSGPASRESAHVIGMAARNQSTSVWLARGFTRSGRQLRVEFPFT